MKRKITYNSRRAPLPEDPSPIPAAPQAFQPPTQSGRKSRDRKWTPRPRNGRHARRTLPHQDARKSRANRHPAPPILSDDPQGHPQIRYYIPSVARQVARIVVMHQMDYEAAVTEMLHGNTEHAHVRLIANNIEKDETVQKFIQEELTIHGLDDASKEIYVRELWNWFRHGPENKAMAAARILGRGFIAEKVETTKPEELPLSGLGSDVRKMLGMETETPANATDDIAVQETAPGHARGSLLDSEVPDAPKV